MITLEIIEKQQEIILEIEKEKEIEISVESGTGGMLPYYDGEYEFTPRTTEILIPTKNKSMVDDVTIFQIPYKEVSNPEGGHTVTIGIE